MRWICLWPGISAPLGETEQPMLHEVMPTTCLRASQYIYYIRWNCKRKLNIKDRAKKVAEKLGTY